MFKLDVKKNGKVVHQVGGSSREDCLAQLQPYFEHKTFGEPAREETVLVSEAIPEVRDENGNVIQETVEAVYETVVTPAEYEIIVINLLDDPDYLLENCLNSRRLEYPPMEDYLDAIVKNDTVALNEYIQKCLAVKNKYPKPG